jgi:hypothetical protein
MIESELKRVLRNIKFKECGTYLHLSFYILNQIIKIKSILSLKVIYYDNSL